MIRKRFVEWSGLAALSWRMALLVAVPGQVAWADTIPTEGTALYVELAGRVDPDVMGGDIGGLGFVNPYVSARGGLSLLASEPLEDFFTGANLGVYAHLPWRVAPFVGLGVFVGYSRERVSADDDERDNDRDGFVDEGGEDRVIVDNVTASVYPEAGLLVWLSDSTRLSLSARYPLSSEGRDQDAWVYAVGLAIVGP